MTGFLLGTILWIGLVTSGAEALRKVPSIGTYIIHIGPLALQTIAKQHSANGGTIVAFAFKTGFLWYIATIFLLSLAAAFAWNITANKSGSHPPKPD